MARKSSIAPKVSFAGKDRKVVNYCKHIICIRRSTRQALEATGFDCIRACRFPDALLMLQPLRLDLFAMLCCSVCVHMFSTISMLLETSADPLFAASLSLLFVTVASFACLFLCLTRRHRSREIGAVSLSPFAHFPCFGAILPARDPGGGVLFHGSAFALLPLPFSLFSRLSIRAPLLVFCTSCLPRAPSEMPGHLELAWVPAPPPPKPKPLCVLL